MNNKTDTITISKKEVYKTGGVVVLSLKEYKDLLGERAIPHYQLEGKEAEELDKLVEEGLKEYREGKTIKASSLKEAMEIYDREADK